MNVRLFFAALTVALTAHCAAAQTTINGLTANAAPLTTDEVACQHAADGTTLGTTKKCSLAQIATVVQTTPIAGSTATDSASVGSELTSSSGWTSTGWTGAYNSFTHTTGNTSPLSYAIAGMAANQSYLVSVTVSGMTTGSITGSIGGTVLTFGGGGGGVAQLINTNATYATGPRSAGTGAFTLTPTTNFNGAVSVSVKLITQITTNNFVMNDSTGAAVTSLSQQLHNTGNLFAGAPGNNMGGRFNTPVLSGFTNGPPGTANTAFGVNSLGFNTTGANNTAVGQVALAVNTTGFENTSVGVDSMANNISGGTNSAFGGQALGNNISGDQNTAVGVQASYTQTTASDNTAIGYTALNNNVSGGNNIAVGGGALFHNTTSNNTAVGASAMANETSGGSNVAVGYLAMSATSGATNNVAIGVQSLQVATSADNVAIGAGALQNLSSGSQTTAVGFQAAFSAATASQNSAFGFEALLQTTGGNNTAFGYDAGFNLTSGTNGVYIGDQTEPNAATDNNEIVIGHGATGAGSNTTTIGNSSTTTTIIKGQVQAPSVVTTGDQSVGGHSESTGTAPTLTSGWGTGATISGNDNVGVITVGTSPSSTEVMTFATAWTNAPVCMTHQVVSGAGAAANNYNNTASTLTYSVALSAGSTFQYSCSGHH